MKINQKRIFFLKEVKAYYHQYLFGSPQLAGARGSFSHGVTTVSWCRLCTEPILFKEPSPSKRPGWTQTKDWLIPASNQK